MKKLIIIAVSTALAGGSITAANAGAAATTLPHGMSGQAGALSPIEKTQVFIFEDRRYCFYDDGWRGPGYYWCGYAWRRGYGWGGPLGWRGWRRDGDYRSRDRDRDRDRGRDRRGDRDGDRRAPPKGPGGPPGLPLPPK